MIFDNLSIWEALKLYLKLHTSRCMTCCCAWFNDNKWHLLLCTHVRFLKVLICRCPNDIWVLQRGRRRWIVAFVWHEKTWNTVSWELLLQKLVVVMYFLDLTTFGLNVWKKGSMTICITFFVCVCVPHTFFLYVFERKKLKKLTRFGKTKLSK